MCNEKHGSYLHSCFTLFFFGGEIQTTHMEDETYARMTTRAIVNESHVVRGGE